MKYNILLFILITSCCNDKNKTFTGYIVAKEHKLARMSDEDEKTVNYAVVIPRVTVATHSSPYRIDEGWFWYIANKNKVIEVKINKKMFYTKKCGDKVTVKL